MQLTAKIKIKSTKRSAKNLSSDFGFENYQIATYNPYDDDSSQAVYFYI